MDKKKMKKYLKYLEELVISWDECSGPGMTKFVEIHKPGARELCYSLVRHSMEVTAQFYPHNGEFLEQEFRKILGCMTDREIKNENEASDWETRFI